MIDTYKFTPNWISPPGDTILDLLSERNLSISDFDEFVSDGSLDINKLLNGELEIDNSIAQYLASFFVTSKSFWIKRDAQYRENKQSLSMQIDTLTPMKWLKDFPISDMVKSGWICADRTFQSRFNACLQFFNVSSISEWETNYKNRVEQALFKTSYAYENEYKSTTSWLRYGEICSAKETYSSWNATLLKEKLPFLRSLTRERCFSEAVQKAKQVCSACGVAFIIGQTPRNCHSSGATFIKSDNTVVLMLSCRFKSDDHFWFSFFHEIGHLLLHKRQLFLETPKNYLTNEENEANQFAQEVLIPAFLSSELNQLIASGKEMHNARRIIRFAKKIGVSAGIVVGQLQFQKIIPHSRLNKLKKTITHDDLMKVMANS